MSFEFEVKKKNRYFFSRPKVVLNSAVQHGSMSVVMQNVRNLFVFILKSEVALWVFGKTRVKYQRWKRFRNCHSIVQTISESMPS